LDFVQARAGVNAIFVATQSFDRGVQGRQIAGRPFPGHGSAEPDDHRGGSYVTQHSRYYAHSAIRPHRARDAQLNGFDVLGDVLPQARARDLAVYSFVLENTHSGLTRAVTNWPTVLQVDAWGRADPYACVRNPGYVAWWLALIEDQLKSYPIDGLMFGSERSGPLGNTIARGGFARNGNPYCFCSHCAAAGERRGLDVRRAKEGYRALDALCCGQGDAEGADGSFVGFLRLIMTYPEIVAWEQLWHDGYEDLQRRIYGTAKYLAPEVQVGWHIWHYNSFSPLYRAHMDFRKIAEYSDFVKPVLYGDCAGYRLHHHIKTVGATIFRGVDEQTLYDLYRGMLGYDEAVRFEDLPKTGLSPDYVRRETRRTVAGVAGNARVYPGIDVNVSTPEHVKQTTPDDLCQAALATLEGGADGFVLSRKYSEMSLANLEAVGQLLATRRDMP
jgi:hypothetical protein